MPNIFPYKKYLFSNIYILFWYVWIALTVIHIIFKGDNYILARNWHWLNEAIF